MGALALWARAGLAGPGPQPQTEPQQKGTLLGHGVSGVITFLALTGSLNFKLNVAHWRVGSCESEGSLGGAGGRATE